MRPHARTAAPAEDRPHTPPADGHPPDDSRHDTPDTATANGLDAKGRFAKGNKGAPGNPFARQVAALRRALLDVVTEEDMAAIARELVRQARDGDLPAVKLLLSYTVGRPAEAVHPHTFDLQEWQLYRRGAQAGPELAGMLHAMPVQLACDIQRAARPGVGELYRRGLLDGCRRRNSRTRRQRRRARTTPTRRAWGRVRQWNWGRNRLRRRGPRSSRLPPPGRNSGCRGG